MHACVVRSHTIKESACACSHLTLLALLLLLQLLQQLGAALQVKQRPHQLPRHNLQRQGRHCEAQPPYEHLKAAEEQVVRHRVAKFVDNSERNLP